MVVFTTVVAELSKDVLTLIPDPRDCGRNEYHQYEFCQQQFLDSSLEHPTVEDVLHHCLNYGSATLPCSEFERITSLESLSCVQRKGTYLYNKMKYLFPNMQIMWSKETADEEALKVHSSWESMLSIYQWLENFARNLAHDNETKDFDHKYLSAVKESVYNEADSVVSRRTSANTNGGNTESQQIEMCSDNCTTEKHWLTEVTGNDDMSFSKYTKEELNVSVIDGADVLNSFNNSLSDSKLNCDELLACQPCSFQETAVDVLRAHLRNCNKNTSVSKQDVQVNNKPTVGKRATRRKKRAHRQNSLRPVTLVENLESVGNCNDVEKSPSPLDGRNSHLLIETEFKKGCDMENELPTCEKIPLQLSQDLVNVPDVSKNSRNLLKKQSCVGDSKYKNLKSVKRNPGTGTTSVFGCNLCEFLTSKQRNLVFHRIRVHGERHLSCHVCSKRFAIQKDLNQHLRFHSERYCCEQCGKTLRSKHALTLHISVVHEKARPKPVRSYLCNLCGHLCRNKTDYTIHCNREHLGIHPHACKICGMRFFAKTNLKVHMQTHGESRDFVCTECGKTFRQRQGLRAHRVIHKSERPYQCSLCEKTFTQRGALVRHARTHTTERPYACKLCTSAFNDYSILRRHMLGIHKMEDTAVLRKTVKEACAEARDVERNRLTGQCKTESSGFDTANTLIALSQQFQEHSLDSNASNSEPSKDRSSFDSCALVHGFHSETFPILSLPDVAADPKQNLASSSPVICLSSSNIVTASMEQVTDPSGVFSCQPVGADLVQYISVPYDHIILAGLAQHSEHLQQSGM